MKAPLSNSTPQAHFSHSHTTRLYGLLFRNCIKAELPQLESEIQEKQKAPLI